MGKACGMENLENAQSMEWNRFLKKVDEARNLLLELQKQVRDLEALWPVPRPSIHYRQPFPVPLTAGDRRPTRDVFIFHSTSHKLLLDNELITRGSQADLCCCILARASSSGEECVEFHYSDFKTDTSLYGSHKGTNFEAKFRRILKYWRETAPVAILKGPAKQGRFQVCIKRPFTLETV
jgi:hypothetical protein